VAIAQVATGNVDGARQSVAAALSAHGDFPPALIVEARMQAAAGDLPGAIARLDKALAISPRDHDAWKIRGDVLGAQGDAAKAHESYRKAIEIRPDFVLAHAALVSSLMQQSKQEEATQAFDAMNKVAPKHPRTLFLSSQIAFQKKDIKSARVASQELLSLTPNNPNALQLAGAIEIQSGSLLQAESYCRRYSRFSQRPRKTPICLHWPVRCTC
jgi:Tfp pilus assembly protein PilF